MDEFGFEPDDNSGGGVATETGGGNDFGFQPDDSPAAHQDFGFTPDTPEAAAEPSLTPETDKVMEVKVPQPSGARMIAKGLDYAFSKIPIPTEEGHLPPHLLEDLMGEPPPDPGGLIPRIPQQQGKVAQAAAGVGNIPIDFANFATTPEGVATLYGMGGLPTAVQRLAGLGFAEEMVRHGVSAPTLQEKVSGIGGGLAVGGLTGLDYYSGRGRPVVAQPEPPPTAGPSVITDPRFMLQAPPAAAARPVTAVEGAAPVTDVRAATDRFNELAAEAQSLGRELKLMQQAGLGSQVGPIVNRLAAIQEEMRTVGEPAETRFTANIQEPLSPQEAAVQGARARGKGLQTIQAEIGGDQGAVEPGVSQIQGGEAEVGGVAGTSRQGSATGGGDISLGETEGEGARGSLPGEEGAQVKPGVSIGHEGEVYIKTPDGWRRVNARGAPSKQKVSGELQDELENRGRSSTEHAALLSPGEFAQEAQGPLRSLVKDADPDTLDWRYGAYDALEDAVVKGKPVNARLWDEIMEHPPEDYAKKGDRYEPDVQERTVSPETNMEYSLGDAARNAFSKKTSGVHRLLQRVSDHFSKVAGNAVEQYEPPDLSSPAGRRLPRRDRRIIQTLVDAGKAFGTDLIWYRGKGGPGSGLDRWSGAHHGGSVFINIDSALGRDPLHMIMGHELTHFLESRTPDFYRWYRQRVFDALKSKTLPEGGFGGRIRGHYEPGRYIDEIASEITAEAVRDPAMFKRLIGQKPTMMERFRSGLNQFSNWAKQKVLGHPEVSRESASALVNNIKQIRRDVFDTFSSARKRITEEGEPADRGATRFAPPRGPPPGEMTLEQFEAAAKRGRMRPATGVTTAAEKALDRTKARPYDYGRAAGYPIEDIAHFYRNFPGLTPEQAYKYFVDDAKAGTLSAPKVDMAPPPPGERNKWDDILAANPDLAKPGFAAEAKRWNELKKIADDLGMPMKEQARFIRYGMEGVIGPGEAPAQRVARFDDATFYEQLDGSWTDTKDGKNADLSFDNSFQLMDALQKAGAHDEVDRLFNQPDLSPPRAKTHEKRAAETAERAADDIGKVNIDRLLEHGKSTRTNARRLRRFLPSERHVSGPAAMVRSAVTTLKDNLVRMTREVQKQPWADAASKQYRGYNVMSHRLADELGPDIKRMDGREVRPEDFMVSESGLSPNTSPEQSFEASRRIAKMLGHNQNDRFDSKMQEWARNAKTKPKKGPEKSLYSEKELAFLKDKTLSELPSKGMWQAKWMRAYDQVTHGDRKLRTIRPDGSYGQYDKTPTGKPNSFAWTTFTHMQNGIDALTGARTPEQILKKPKTSNYYMSKLLGFTPSNHVVVDTHHTSAAFANSIPSGHELVRKAFAAVRGGKDRSYAGLYSIIHEATNQAAREVGMDPKELQALIWGYQRGYRSPDSFGRSDVGKKAVTDIQQLWKDAAKGKITEEQAHEGTEEIANKFHGGTIPAPAYYEPGYRLRPGNRASKDFGDAGNPAELPGRRGDVGAPERGGRSEPPGRAATEPSLSPPITDPKDYPGYEKSDHIEDPERLDLALASQAKKGSEVVAASPETDTLQLGVNLQQIMHLVGPQMYSKPIQEVATKELLQNALDASRSAGATMTRPKRIDINTDRDNRTIEVKDQGAGMTPQIVKDAFFTIGGTYKTADPANTSGGLGLAKMAFILGSKRIHLETVKDGLKSTVDATSDQVRNGSFQIVKERTEEPNGTKVQVEIPENYVNANGENRPIDFFIQPDFLERPLIGPVEVFHNGEKTNLGVNTKNYQLDNKFNFDWGHIDVYVNPKKTEYPKFDVLSAGLHQFNISKYDVYQGDMVENALPYNMVLDVRPNVRTDNPAYPFNNQREGFRGTIQDDVEAMYNFFRRQSVEQQLLEARDTFRDLKQLPEVDPLKSLTQDQLDQIYAGESSAPPPALRPKRKVKSIDFGQGNVTINYDTGKPDVESRQSYVEKSFKPERDVDLEKTGLDVSELDPNKPYLHNNTNADFTDIKNLPELETKLGNSLIKFMREWGKRIENYKDLALTDPSGWFGGISYDKGYRGLNTVKPFKGIWFNPGNLSRAALESPAAAASETLHIFIHEITHVNQRNEGPRFTSELATNYARLRARGIPVAKFEKALENIYNHHWNEVREVNDEFQSYNTENSGRSFKSASAVGPERPGEIEPVAEGAPGVDVSRDERVQEQGRAGAGGATEANPNAGPVGEILQGDITRGADREPSLSPPRGEEERQPIPRMGMRERTTPLEGRGISNEATGAARRAMGFPGKAPVGRRTWEQAMEEAVARKAEGPILVKSLKRNPRPITDTEDMMLLNEQVKAERSYDGAVARMNANPGDKASRSLLDAARDQVQDIYDINDSVGTATARGLNARKHLTDQNYTLPQMEARVRAEVNDGAPLTGKKGERILVKTRSAFDRIRNADQALEKYQRKRKLTPEDIIRPQTGEASQDIQTAPPTSKLERDKERVRAGIKDYETRTAAKDTSPLRPKRAEPTDPELLRLLYERDKARSAYEDMVDQERLKASPIWRKLGHYAVEIAVTAPRSIKTAYDLSAVGLQGSLLTAAHPLGGAQSLSKMGRGMWTDYGQYKVMKEITDDPMYHRLVKQYRLEIQDPSAAKLTQREEVFRSRLADKIPGVGISNRAYTTYLNGIRWHSLKSMVNLTEWLLGRGLKQNEGKVLANYVNIASGRGYFGRMSGAADAAANILWSPRNAVSRVQYLAGYPIWGQAKQGLALPARAMVTFEYARTLAGIGLLTSLGVMAGMSLEKDPRSGNFGLRWGNTRLDLTGGLKSYINYFSRMWTNEIKTQKGEVKKLGQDPLTPDAWELTTRLLRGKLAPAEASFFNVMTGELPTGQPTTLTNELLQYYVPLTPENIAEALQAQGVPQKAIFSLLALGGANVATYDSTNAASRRVATRQMQERDSALWHGNFKKAYNLSTTPPPKVPSYNRGGSPFPKPVRPPYAHSLAGHH